MVFAHTDQSIATRVDNEIGIAQAFGGSQLLQSAGIIDSINELVGEVGEVDDAVGDGVSASSIFVDARSCAVGFGYEVGDVALGVAANDDIAATFGGAHFRPVDRLAIERDCSEPYRAFDDEVRGDGRAPGSVWCLSWIIHSDTLAVTS